MSALGPSRQSSSRTQSGAAVKTWRCPPAEVWLTQVPSVDLPHGGAPGLTTNYSGQMSWVPSERVSSPCGLALGLVIGPSPSVSSSPGPPTSNPGVEADVGGAAPGSTGACLLAEGRQEYSSSDLTLWPRMHPPSKEGEEATLASGGNFLFPGYPNQPPTPAQEPASHLANKETETQRGPYPQGLPTMQLAGVMAET